MPDNIMQIAFVSAMNKAKVREIFEKKKRKIGEKGSKFFQEQYTKDIETVKLSYRYQNELFKAENTPIYIQHDRGDTKTIYVINKFQKAIDCLNGLGVYNFPPGFKIYKMQNGLPFVKTGYQNSRAVEFENSENVKLNERVFTDIFKTGGFRNSLKGKELEVYEQFVLDNLFRKKEDFTLFDGRQTQASTLEFRNKNGDFIILVYKGTQELGIKPFTYQGKINTDINFNRYIFEDYMKIDKFAEKVPILNSLTGSGKDLESKMQGLKNLLSEIYSDKKNRIESLNEGIEYIDYRIENNREDLVKKLELIENISDDKQSFYINVEDKIKKVEDDELRDDLENRLMDIHRSYAVDFTKHFNEVNKKIPTYTDLKRAIEAISLMIDQLYKTNLEKISRVVGHTNKLYGEDNLDSIINELEKLLNMCKFVLNLLKAKEELESKKKLSVIDTK